jgi:hypothetical protein
MGEAWGAGFLSGAGAALGLGLADKALLGVPAPPLAPAVYPHDSYTLQHLEELRMEAKWQVCVFTREMSRSYLACMHTAALKNCTRVFVSLACLLSGVLLCALYWNEHAKALCQMLGNNFYLG